MSLCTSILASGARGMHRIARSASHQRHATPCASRLSSRVRCAALRAPVMVTRSTYVLTPAAAASGEQDADSNSRCASDS